MIKLVPLGKIRGMYSSSNNPITDSLNENRVPDFGFNTSVSNVKHLNPLCKHQALSNEVLLNFISACSLDKTILS